MFGKYLYQLLELSCASNKKEMSRSNFCKNLQTRKNNFFLGILETFFFIWHVWNNSVKQSCNLLRTKRAFCVQSFQKLKCRFSYWQTMVDLMLERSKIDFNNQVLSNFSFLVSEILYFTNNLNN